MENKTLCHGAWTPALIAVGHGAVEMDVNEVKEEWMVTGKELGVQSSSGRRRRECWRRSVLPDNISFFSFHKCLSVFRTSSQDCGFPWLSSVSVWVVCSFL